LYKDRRIAVVVPAYNEEQFVLTVLETMPDFVDDIVVVDDCSTDGTYRVVSEANIDRVVALMTPRNQGVGGATSLGYRKALDLGADIVVKMDADAQMAPEFLPDLLDAVIEEDYDYAKGNRFLTPEFLPAMPRFRFIGNLALTFLTKLATGYWSVFDPQNGYTAVKASVLRAVDLDKVHRGYFFENDMLVQLALRDARVKDVAIPARYGGEVSGLNLLQVLLTFPLLLLHRGFRRVWHNYVVRDFNPIALFLALGLLLLTWGTGFGIYTWVRSAVSGEVASTGTVMLSVLPFFIGFQLVLQAIVLDIQHAPR
jgi:glycosyltransferase involved in cell wall biosynthesis